MKLLEIWNTIKAGCQVHTHITASQLVVDAKLQQFHEEIYQGQEEAAMYECNGQTSPIN